MSLYLPISVAVPLVGVGEAGVEVGQPLLYQGVSLGHQTMYKTPYKSFTLLKVSLLIRYDKIETIFGNSLLSSIEI